MKERTFMMRVTRRHRAGGLVVATATVGLLLAACASSSTVDIESLGLAVEADIQAGTQFELVVPAQPDTTIEVVLAPAGVTASITGAGEGESLLLRVAVEYDTPRGAYNLALRVVQDGEEFELGWPFEVIDAGTDSTVSGSTEALLTVDSPQIGGLVPSPSVLSGRSSSATVGYTLSAGSLVLAEGTIDVIAGAFSTTLEFTNTCCIEMVLEVFQPGDDGLATTIPVAYPESG